MTHVHEPALSLDENIILQQATALAAREAQVAALQARCEAAERDAARYRWLRENEWDPPIVNLFYDDYENAQGIVLDAAIDALLADVPSGEG